MTEPIDYLIVGGGVSGGHAVYSIREFDKKGRILVVNHEDHFPYDRPPLSKEYLAGKAKKGDLFFRADSYYSRNKVEFLRKQTVTGIDTANRSVRLDDGRQLFYRTLLLATGGFPRRLNLPGSDLDGIHYLRSLEDCEAIKKKARRSRRVAIVGGGFIGCEVAATLRSKGLEVTLIHRAARILDDAIDRETAVWIQKYHSSKGVRVITRAEASGFSGKEKVRDVRLKDGTSVPADLVIVGIGIELNVGLAKDADLKLEKGAVAIDQYMETSAKGVYAAGDIATFYSPFFKRRLRLEHVDVAQKLGATAGANMAGQKRPFDELPYFFSNQYDLELNAYGDLSKYDAIVRRGKMDVKKGFLMFYFDGKLLNAVLSVNAEWEEIEAAKNLVESRKAFPDRGVVGDRSMDLRAIGKALGARSEG